jgi:ComF family protein
MGKAEALRNAVSRLRVPAMLIHGADALVSATLAPRCAACACVLEAPLGGPVCPRCWDDARRGSGTYDGALRQIIHAFKYEGRTSLARPLGLLLRERGASVLRDADCVVAVPLFAWKRLRRGFNQSAELAHHLDLPVVDALWRTRPTVTQTGLTAAQRRRNVRGAFRLSPLLGGRAHDRYIQNRVVVLVDDVMTTGSTLDACADVLLASGACEVRRLTLARAELATSRRRR